MPLHGQPSGKCQDWVVLAQCVWRGSPPCRHSACLLCMAQRHTCEPRGSVCLTWKNTAGSKLNPANSTDTPAHMYKCSLRNRPLVYGKCKEVGPPTNTIFVWRRWQPEIIIFQILQIARKAAKSILQQTCYIAVSASHKSRPMNQLNYTLSVLQQWSHLVVKNGIAVIGSSLKTLHCDLLSAGGNTIYIKSGVSLTV